MRGKGTQNRGGAQLCGGAGARTRNRGGHRQRPREVKVWAEMVGQAERLDSVRAAGESGAHANL